MAKLEATETHSVELLSFAGLFQKLDKAGLGDREDQYSIAKPLQRSVLTA